MDPLRSDGIDPGLLRVIEKRGNERDTASKRRRVVPAKEQEQNPGQEQSAFDPPAHELDDLA